MIMAMDEKGFRLSIFFFFFFFLFFLNWEYRARAGLKVD